MANDFKRFAVNNVNTSSGASATAVYTVTAGAGSSALESIVIGITLSNTTSAGITASVFLDNNSGSNDVRFVLHSDWEFGKSSKHGESFGKSLFTSSVGGLPGSVDVCS